MTKIRLVLLINRYIYVFIILITVSVKWTFTGHVMKTLSTRKSGTLKATMVWSLCRSFMKIRRLSVW